MAAAAPTAQDKGRGQKKKDFVMAFYPYQTFFCISLAVLIDIPTPKPVIGKGEWHYNGCLRQIIIHPLASVATHYEIRILLGKKGNGCYISLLELNNRKLETRKSNIKVQQVSISGEDSLPV